jgi:UDP-glucose 4-epimerase
MELNRVLITGGAGFLGSHLVDRLIDTHEVVVLDDLSTGSMDNLAVHVDNKRFTFIEGGISSEAIVKAALEGVHMVYHFAAQPDVQLSTELPYWDFEVNVVGTMKLLEVMRKSDVNHVIFASSGGTIYGETKLLPTPESAASRPISNYGAAKCAIEMYLSSYSTLYGFNSISLRLANTIGSRLVHGVIYDFYRSLKRNSTVLEVLGNGEQEKSYLYVTDAIEAAILLARDLRNGFHPVNVASGERLKVSRIAQLVIAELGLLDTRIEYAGGERGWPGDITRTDIDTSLLRSLGWQPRVPISKAIGRCVRWLVKKFGPVE